MAASRHLGDSELAAAVEYKINAENLQVALSSKEKVEIAGEISDDITPAGMSTNMTYALKVATKWRNSSFCESAVEQFQAHIKENVKQHSASIGLPSEPGSCAKYIAQHWWAYYPQAQKYSKEMQEGLQASIKNAATALKDYQQEFVRAQLSRGRHDELADAILTSCKNTDSLATGIKSIEFLKNLDSPRSESLAAYLKNLPQERDCGEMKDVYCRSDLIKQAAEIAYGESKRCDRDEASGAACNRDVPTSVNEESLKLEKEALNIAKTKYEQYVAKVGQYDWFSHGSMYVYGEKCKRKAVEVLGLRQEAFYEYTDRVCLPEAREEFMKKEKSLLDKINARLAEMEAERAKQ